MFVLVSLTFLKLLKLLLEYFYFKSLSEFTYVQNNSPPERMKICLALNNIMQHSNF